MLVKTKLDGYMVDEEGSVWSSVRWRGMSLHKLTPHKNGHGYLRVKIHIDEKPRTVFVHKLVCATFHGEKPTPNHEVRHLNGIRTDNRPSNLRWGTRAENARDRILHGTCSAAANGVVGSYKGQQKIAVMRSEGAFPQAKGVRQGSAVLTEIDVIAIFCSATSERVIAKEYGVSPSTVGAIRRRLNWGWLTQQLTRGTTNDQT